MIWGSIRDSSESWWPTCIVMNQMALSLRSFADDLSFPKDCTSSSWLCPTRNWDLAWWIDRNVPCLDLCFIVRVGWGLKWVVQLIGVWVVLCAVCCDCEVSGWYCDYGRCATWYLYDVRCGWVGDHPNSSGWDGHPNFERQSFWKVLAIWLESRWKGTCTMCDVGEWGITQIQVDEMDILTLKDNHFGRYLQFGLRVAGRVLVRCAMWVSGGSPKFKWMRWTS